MNQVYKIFIRTRHTATRILYICLAVSLMTLVIYLMDWDFNDTTLFLLLAVLRYSSFFLCICSLHKLLLNIFHFSRRPSVLRAMKNLLYLFFLIYGIFIIFLESFIVVAAGGNV